MRSIVQYLESNELQFRQSGYHTMNLTRTRRLQISLGEVITDPDIAGRCGELIDCILIDIPALNVHLYNDLTWKNSIPSDSTTTIWPSISTIPFSNSSDNISHIIYTDIVHYRSQNEYQENFTDGNILYKPTLILSFIPIGFSKFNLTFFVSVKILQKLFMIT